MAEFINTIDLLGDDAVVDSIIDRTIAEFKDDKITAVGNHAFYECMALADVDVPNVTICGIRAFARCSGIKKMVLPATVTVGNEAFYAATGLRIIEFRSVVNIGAGVFNLANALVAIVMRNTSGVSSVQDSTLSGNYAIQTVKSCFFYVPRALIEDYKAATNWSSYADRFRALEDYTVDGTITGELDETKI